MVYLSLLTFLWDKHYYPHFIDDEIEESSDQVSCVSLPAKK